MYSVLEQSDWSGIVANLVCTQEVSGLVILEGMVICRIVGMGDINTATYDSSNGLLGGFIQGFMDTGVNQLS